jgi:2-keto-4-pentenoate hydratase/2-oxohepta-3-ene-1,7-dioic acid hydratase in catechol pathway
MAKLIKTTKTNTPIEVGKIMCLGSNYDKHIKEMKSPKINTPAVFLKPATAILEDNGLIVIPAISKELHHEIELVIVIGQEGKNIPADQAMDYVLGYALGLDLTLRDIQNEAKVLGRPWAIAKGFDTSAPLSDVIRKQEIADPHDLNLKLWVNDHLRQSGSTKDMIMKIPQIIAFLSTFFTLQAGDLIFTGTPEGVGPLLPGDKVHAEIEQHIQLNLSVTQEQ